MSAFTFSPDGQFFVTGCWEGTIKVWRTERVELLRTVSGHRARISALWVTNDGRQLLPISDDASVKLWRIATGEAVAAFTADGPLEHLAVSRSGERALVAQKDGRVHVLNLVGLAEA